MCRVLRIANKYMMESIREWAVMRLKEKVYAPFDTSTQLLAALKCYAEDPARGTSIILLPPPLHSPFGTQLVRSSASPKPQTSPSSSPWHSTPSPPPHGFTHASPKPGPTSPTPTSNARSRVRRSSTNSGRNSASNAKRCPRRPSARASSPRGRATSGTRRAR